VEDDKAIAGADKISTTAETVAENGSTAGSVPAQCDQRFVSTQERGGWSRCSADTGERLTISAAGSSVPPLLRYDEGFTRRSRA